MKMFFAQDIFSTFSYELYCLNILVPGDSDLV